MNQLYKANITAGALLVTESRKIADLMVRDVSADEWTRAIDEENVLQKLSASSAKRTSNYIKARLRLMTPELWEMVRDRGMQTATHAVFAAAIKHCRILGDYLDLVVREQFRRFEEQLTRRIWEDFLQTCKQRDPSMKDFPPPTEQKMRSNVHKILFEAGYISDLNFWKLQKVEIDIEVLNYLEKSNEHYILKCIKVC